MKKILLFVGLGFALTACTAAEIPAPLAVDTQAPTGVARDFVAVYESRDGALVSTTEIAQSGTGIVMRKKSNAATTICHNLTHRLLCQSGSGTLLSADDAAKALRIEALTTQRLLGMQRVLGEDIKATARQIPTNLALFKKDAFTPALSPFVGPQPEATLTACFERATAEEKEFFCFGGGLMPYWADTTYTSIGNIILMRALKAYSSVSLTPQQLKEILRSFEQ